MGSLETLVKTFQYGGDYEGSNCQISVPITTDWKY